MPVYFGSWKLNTNLPPPPTPDDQIKQSEGFAELVKAQLKAGIIKEVHAFVEGNQGYFITGDVSDETQFEALAMWSPYVTFELHRTIPFPRASELFTSALKKRAGRG